MPDWAFDGISWAFNATATPAYSDANPGQPGDIEDLRQQAEEANTGAALPWMSIAVDFTPVYGDIKGVVEAGTGTDLGTHNELGQWRWLGLFGLSELRHLNNFGCVSHSQKLRLLGKVPPSEITLMGFRGVHRNEKYANEHVLIKAGHVGISWDGGKTVYGFWPSTEIMNDLAAKGTDVTQHLKGGGTIIGQVQDDTQVFRRAYELSKQGADTGVWQMSIPISEKELDQIVSNVLDQVDNGSPYPSWYRWPSRGGEPMPPQCNNCATWPRTQEIPIPENTGQMSRYMDALKSQGVPWEP